MKKSPPKNKKKVILPPKTIERIKLAKKKRRKNQKSAKEEYIRKPIFGRPVKYKTVEELQTVIEDYFNDMWEHNEKRPLSPIHPTVTGLAIALDLTRKGLIDYEHKNKDFCNTIKKAKAMIEEYIERRLYYQNPTGCIFNLKNNFNWKDKTETELSTKTGLSALLEELDGQSAGLPKSRT